MLYLTCTTIKSVDLAHYAVYRAKDWISVDLGTIINTFQSFFFPEQMPKCTREIITCGYKVNTNVPFSTFPGRAVMVFPR